MTKIDIPIPIYKLALLQAYLYQIYSQVNACKENFENTEWYLNENFSTEDRKNIFQFFDRLGLKCDCDVMRMLDLKDIGRRE